ncbi:MAG: hypothetical protein JXR83_11385 [Deltaproteobacteria bacterium]|nr:hypothetical protein [Deltaproteobacteria bacterium]
MTWPPPEGCPPVRRHVLAGALAGALAALTGAGCEIFTALGGGGGLPCTDDLSCPTGYSCTAGRCQRLALCESDQGCPAGYYCDRDLRICVTPADAGAGDAGDAATPDRGPDAAQTDRGGATDAAVCDHTTADRTAGDRTSGDGAHSDQQTADAAPADGGADRAAISDAGGIDALLYQQQFAGPLADLQDDDGTWGLDNGVLKQTDVCLINADCHVMDRDFGDIAVSVELRFDDACMIGPQQAGAFVRSQGSAVCDNHYYVCVVDGDDARLYLGKLDGACTTTAAGNAVLPTINFDTWYRMTVTAIGGTIRCTLSGDGWPESFNVAWQDNGTVLPPGEVGLVTAGAAASFDNLRVEAR